jgi:hypothetical protein
MFTPPDGSKVLLMLTLVLVLSASLRRKVVTTSSASLMLTGLLLGLKALTAVLSLAGTFVVSPLTAVAMFTLPEVSKVLLILIPVLVVPTSLRGEEFLTPSSGS